MPDDADRASQDAEILDNAVIKDISQRANQIDPGIAGECDHCGEYMLRIVRGACCRCRDLRKLP